MRKMIFPLSAQHDIVFVIENMHSYKLDADDTPLDMRFIRWWWWCSPLDITKACYCCYIMYERLYQRNLIACHCCRYNNNNNNNNASSTPTLCINFQPGERVWNEENSHHYICLLSPIRECNTIYACLYACVLINHQQQHKILAENNRLCSSSQQT